MDAAVLSRRRLLGRSLASTAVAAMAALGIDLRPTQARAWTLRIAEAKQYPSVCPYCAVGCDTMIYAKDGAILDIEGDPNSPINQGTLCPKGAATFGLLTSPKRLDRCLHRAPGARTWREVPLDWAMDRIAELTKATRDASFVARLPDGTRVNHTLAVGSLGGATLDNEENYLIKKLFTAAGAIQIENQARI